MRTAFCLYGQPRNFSENWRYLYNNVIAPNNADVFFHTWYNPNDVNMHKMTPGHENRIFEYGLDQILPDATKAVSYKIETQIPFYGKSVMTSEENIEKCWPWSRGYDKDVFLKDRVKSHYSMWYSINQTLTLKELYAQKNGFEYDCVIISRFDVSPKISVNVSKFNLNNIISGYEPLPRNEINDWFIISNNINSNIISSVFYTIDYHRNNIISNGGVWTNEAYLRDQLKLYGIGVEFTDLKITF